MSSRNVYDFIFLACFDLFSILHFFTESKLVLGLFNKELFENVAFCFFYEMISVPGMKENCFKTNKIIDTKYKRK